jgi:hypothetical protein
MSNTKEVAKLEWGGFIVRLTIRTLLCAIGFTLFIAGVLAEPSRWLMPRLFGMEGGGADDGLLFILGYLIACGPMILRILSKGLLAGVFDFSSYVVVTTYSDGSTSSDGGAASFDFNAFKLIIGLSVGVCVASIATLLSIIGQWVYLIIMCFVGKNKAPFPAVMPLFLIFTVWLICAPFAAIQMNPFFNPENYNTQLMTEAVAEVKKSLSANSYSYTANVRYHPKGYYGKFDKIPENAKRHTYNAEVTYNKNTGNTVVVIKPINETIYMEYFKKGKNNVPSGTYTFKNGEQINSDSPLSKKGMNEINALMPDVVLAQVEELLAKKTIRETLWGRVSVSTLDISLRRDPLKPDSIRSKAAREVSLYYQPFMHRSWWISLNCYAMTATSNLRIYEFRAPVGNGKKFFMYDDLSYN